MWSVMNHQSRVSLVCCHKNNDFKFTVPMIFTANWIRAVDAQNRYPVCLLVEVGIWEPTCRSQQSLVNVRIQLIRLSWKHSINKQPSVWIRWWFWRCVWVRFERKRGCALPHAVRVWMNSEHKQMRDEGEDERVWTNEATNVLCSWCSFRVFAVICVRVNKTKTFGRMEW